MIDPILEKNIIKQAGVNMIKVTDTAIEYSDDFRLYMTTKLANPNYPPETFGKTMIIKLQCYNARTKRLTTGRSCWV